jgi:hypothetical protein
MVRPANSLVIAEPMSIPAASIRRIQESPRSERHSAAAATRRGGVMKKFLAVFTGSPDAMAAWQSLDESERRRRETDGMQAWKQWVEDRGASIVDHGAPLGKTKRVTAQGIADIRNNLAAYTVVQAESQEAAARMFQNHPHFSIFPGDGVEVMECLPLPEM